MKRVLRLLPAIVLAVFAAACSGGGSGPTPPPPTGGFSNADLKGTYAFLMTGSDTNLEFLGRVGSFTADGNGNITSGIEDVNAASFIGTLPFTASTYSIQKDGRGTINLINSSGTLTFSVTLLSPSQGFIAETDLNATTSGTFNLQSTSAFTSTAVNGPYVFDVSGIAPDTNQNFFPDSIVGQFVTSNGVGSTGVADENFSATPSGPLPITSVTTTFDSTNGPTNGRGELAFTAGGVTFSYVYYIVDATRIRMIETSGGVTLGDAVLQTNAPANNAAFTGSFAYLQGGASTSGPITRVGRFTSDGTGGLGSIALNTNDDGTNARVPKGSVSQATYQIDPNFPGTGRGTATFTDSSLGTFSYIFYMSSASQGVIQNVSKNIVADGTIMAQTGGPFTTAGLAGGFGFSLSGQSFNSQTQILAEGDYVGQLALTSGASQNLTGAADFSEFSSNNGVFLNVVVNGDGLEIQNDGTTASGDSNILQLKFNTSPTSTLNFAAYIVNPQTIFVAGTDNNRIIAGTLVKQSK